MAAASHISKTERLEAQLVNQAVLQEQLQNAHRRIAELEDSSSKNAITTVKQESPHESIWQQKLAAEEQRNQELKADVAECTAWINKFELVAGVPASDAAIEYKKLREQLKNAEGIEAALRAQVRNHEKAARKAEKEASSANNKLAKCQGQLQTQKAQLQRAKYSR